MVCTLPACRKTNTDQESAEPLSEITTSSGIVMIRLAGGWFEMGSDTGNADEQPRHRVFLRPFFMDKYEVTQEEYTRYPLPNPSHFKNPKHPMEQVTWKDAIEFMQAGASAVQIGTAVAFKGVEVFGSVAKGIDNYLKRKGYTNVKDLVGLAHKF